MRNKNFKVSECKKQRWAQSRCLGNIRWLGIETVGTWGGLIAVLMLFPGCRQHLMQVDSVQRWMEDLKLMTECECMCVLQAKPISLEEDAQGDLILAGGPGPGDPLQLLLKRGWVISTELRRIGQKLAQDRWARVHSMSVRLTCHARSMVSEYSAVSRNSSQEMGQVCCLAWARVGTRNWECLLKEWVWVA